jgi:putative membrane protein (TIGR04086 family)
MVKNLKTNVIILLMWFMISLILVTIASVLAYFRIIDVKNSLFILISGIIIFVILGFLSGNIKRSKGLISGLTLALIVIIILVLLQFLGFEEKFSLEKAIKFAIFLVSSAFGGIIGVNFAPLVRRD